MAKVGLLLPRRQSAGVVVRLLVVAAVVVATACTAHSARLDAQRTSPSPVASSTSPAPATPTTPVAAETAFGRSVDGAPLLVSLIGDPSSRVRVLVVGCIHGNEPAGIDIANALARSAPLPGVAVWVVATMNPDGVALGTRQNARGVDLNRNFGYLWQPNGVPFSLNYSGSRPLSEPEAVAAGTLVQQLHPTLAIWFHQAAALVDDSEGPRAAEQLFSRLVGLPLRAMTDYPGSAVGWENHLFGATAFVVELPAGRLSAAQIARYVDAIRAVSRESLPGRSVETRVADRAGT